MSEDLFPETENLPAVTVFYGGKERGRCIQLTKEEREGTQFITIRVEDIPLLVERLRKAAEVMSKIGKAKKEILNYLKPDRIVYPSDVANELGLDLKVAVQALEELAREGKIKEVSPSRR